MERIIEKKIPREKIVEKYVPKIIEKKIEIPKIKYVENKKVTKK